MGVQINNLTVTYEQHPAVHHLTATVDQGEWLAVVGPNGAGKSTLLNAMAGVITDYDGCIEGMRPDTVAYMPQQTQLDKSFPITVFELVATGFWQELGFLKSLGKEQQEQCERALAAVGLQGFEQRLIGTLSGGQLQRSLFARVLLQNQPVILLDEPFNAIDSKTLVDLTQLIEQWHHSDRTVIMVTHDLDYVRQHCPQTLLLARECISHGATVDVLTDENLRRATQLSEAFDARAPWCMT
ncbi:MAG: metal ABC transporter ATP-binding protein [Litoricola sp.]|nr:metal ABC transporter ATP-binding protein [Litorivicinus sp.]MBL6810080.1 metal ABC transporter ATP-binding protein [Litorivicinus sp.]MBL6905763.1 metal ABC transporter ATP-binding protein [Pseudomonadales bacterium]